MSWKVTFHQEAVRIDLTMRGDMSLADMKAATDAALDEIEARACLAVLVDCRQLDPPLPSVVQRLPARYAARNADRRMRIALLMSGTETGRNVSQFYKMAARRLDYIVQLFETRIDAIEWLEHEFVRD